MTPSIAALSRTVRETTPCTAAPCMDSPVSGPEGVNPRPGLRPTRPPLAAGTRIEHPPSAAPRRAGGCGRHPPPSPPRPHGTPPAATAAAAPPDEPPGER